MPTNLEIGNILRKWYLDFYIYRLLLAKSISDFFSLKYI